MHKRIIYIYSIINYAIFLILFLYFIGFINNFIVPKSIDSGVEIPLLLTVAINILLVTLFALQHTIMARPGFKKWITRHLPEAMERSTFVLFANIFLFILMWQWKPIPDLIWNVSNEYITIGLYLINGLGWILAVTSTQLINSKYFFGINQARDNMKGKQISSPEFQIPLFYKIVRHPIMVGFLIGFWVTPKMSAGHLLFAVLMTGYIIIGIQFEERDLIQSFGDRYKEYRKHVSGLVPGIKSGVKFINQRLSN